MVRKIAENLICGALGLGALYAVGRLAYHAGREIAMEECRYDRLREANARMTMTDSEEEVQPRKKQSKVGLIFGAKKILGKKESVVGDLVRNPEAHKIEAFVEGDELQIRVKQKSTP